VVADIADDVLVMYAGRAVEFGSVHDVYYNPSHPYTWGLMGSLPRADMTEKTPLHPIKGMPPSLVDLPEGCAFHPRCPFAKEICHTQTPPDRALNEAHTAACHFAGDVGFTRKNMAGGDGI
jgi:oligopeptide transport system ATP-binding protein